MSKYEHVREPAPEALTADYIDARRQAGWNLVALEWERPSDPARPVALERIEVPYGWKVAGDCRHLEEDPGEQQALFAMMGRIVADTPLSTVAGELNQRGFRMRNGFEWSPAAVFELLPRLVEIGPSLFNSEKSAATRRAGFLSVSCTLNSSEPSSPKSTLLRCEKVMDLA